MPIDKVRFVSVVLKRTLKNEIVRVAHGEILRQAANRNEKIHTRPKGISQIPKGYISLKKGLHNRKPFFGDPPGTRTPDTLIKSQVLYRLS